MKKTKKLKPNQRYRDNKTGFFITEKRFNQLSKKRTSIATLRMKTK